VRAQPTRSRAVYDAEVHQCGERFAVRATVIVDGKRREFCGEKCLAAHQSGEPDFTETL
jgi:hypothetical protein